MEDAFGKTFELFGMVIFIFFALRPDWSIKLLSYGKATVEEVSSSTLLVLRSLAAFCACGLFMYLASSFF
jgi:hypothetical protein